MLEDRRNTVYERLVEFKGSVDLGKYSDRCKIINVEVF